ncbi:hypothetical protein F5Y18DRAFT_423160 [Xylariaceae sp. FL1019]|nr:hypothetical protein F5Y18DRAFT_423160 [Xylariaceae sp. FL1019]
MANPQEVMPAADCPDSTWPWIRRGGPLSNEDAPEGPPIKATRHKRLPGAYPEAFFQFRMPPEYFILDQKQNIMTLDPEEVDNEQVTKYGYERLRGQGGIYTIVSSQDDNQNHMELGQRLKLFTLPEHVFFRWNIPKSRVAEDMVMIRNGNLVTPPLESGVHELRINGGLIDVHNEAGRYKLLEAPVIREVVHKPEDAYSQAFDSQLFNVPPSHLQKARHLHLVKKGEAPVTRLGYWSSLESKREQPESRGFAEFFDESESSELFGISGHGEDDSSEDTEGGSILGSYDIFVFHSNDSYCYRQHKHYRYSENEDDREDAFAGTDGYESDNDSSVESEETDGGVVSHDDEDSEAQSELQEHSVESAAARQATNMVLAHGESPYREEDPLVSAPQQQALATVARHREWLDREEAEEKKNDAKLARRARLAISRDTIRQTREARRIAREKAQTQEQANIESLEKPNAPIAEVVRARRATRPRATYTIDQSSPSPDGSEDQDVDAPYGIGEQQYPESEPLNLVTETEHTGDKDNETVPDTPITTQGLLNNEQDRSASVAQVDNKRKRTDQRRNRNASVSQRAPRRNYDAEADEEFVPVQPRKRRPRAPRAPRAPRSSRSQQVVKTPTSTLNSAQSSAAVPVGAAGAICALRVQHSPTRQLNDRYPNSSMQSPLGKLVIGPPPPRSDVSRPDASEDYMMTGVAASSNQAAVTFESDTPVTAPRSPAAGASGSHTTSAFAPMTEADHTSFASDRL